MTSSGVSAMVALKPKLDLYNYAIKGNFPCIHCDDDIVGIFAHCVTCEKKGRNVNLCVNCLRFGAIVNDHEPQHSYVYQDVGGFVPFEADDANGWNLIELQRLHSAVCKVGMNWEKVAASVRTRSAKSCRKAWLKFFMKRSIGKPCWEEARSRFDRRFEDMNWTRFDDRDRDPLAEAKHGLVTNEIHESFTYDPRRGDFDQLPLASVENMLDMQFPPGLEERYMHAVKLYELDRYNIGLYRRTQQVTMARKFTLAFDFVNSKRLDYTRVRKKDPFFDGLPELRKPAVKALAEEGRRANDMLKPFASHTRGTPYEYLWKVFMVERDLRERVAESIGLKPCVNTLSKKTQSSEALKIKKLTKAASNAKPQRLLRNIAALKSSMAKAEAKIASLTAVIAEADKVEGELAASGLPAKDRVRILVLKNADGTEHYRAVKTVPVTPKKLPGQVPKPLDARSISGERRKDKDKTPKTSVQKAPSEREKRDSSKSRSRSRHSKAKKSKDPEPKKDSNRSRSKSKADKTKPSVEKATPAEESGSSTESKKKKKKKKKKKEKEEKDGRKTSDAEKKEKEKKDGRKTSEAERKENEKKDGRKTSESGEVRTSTEGKSPSSDAKTKSKSGKGKRSDKASVDVKKTKGSKQEGEKAKKRQKRRRDKDGEPDGDSAAKKRKLDGDGKKTKKHGSKKEKKATEPERASSPEIVEIARVSATGKVMVVEEHSQRVSVGSRPGTSGLSLRVSVGTRPGTSGLPPRFGAGMHSVRSEPPPRPVGVPRLRARKASKRPSTHGSSRPAVAKKQPASVQKPPPAVPKPVKKSSFMLQPMELQLLQRLKMGKEKYIKFRNYLRLGFRVNLLTGQAVKLPPGLPEGVAKQIVNVLNHLKLLPSVPAQPQKLPVQGVVTQPPS